MSVMITGAGLIGCHFARRVVDSGETAVLYDLCPNRDYVSKIVGNDRVYIVTGDMRDLPALLKAATEHQPTAVVHTAGLIGSRVSESPYTGAAINIQGTVHVLEAVRLLNIKRLVYVSSRAVYDRSKIKAGPIREDAPIGGNNFYNVTKACAELLIRAYTHHYNLDAVIIRPSAVFGRGHYAGGSSVGGLMRELALEILRGQPFDIDAARYFDNEYVYAKDVAAAIGLACEVKNSRERAYNCGTGTVITAHDIGKVVRELFEIDVRIIGPENSPRKVFPLDVSASRTELGYMPKFPFKRALADYVEEMQMDPL